MKQTDKKEYMVVFPDKNTLGIFSKFSEFEMPLYGLKGVIEIANVDPESSSMLHTLFGSKFPISLLLLRMWNLLKKLLL